MYQNFGFRPNFINEGEEPATVGGKLISPSERRAREDEPAVQDPAALADLEEFRAKAKKEAKEKGMEPGSADEMDFVRERVKEMMGQQGYQESRREGRGYREADPTPGEPATDPNDPTATTTNKDLQPGEGEQPPWLKGKDGEEGFEPEEPGETPDERKARERRNERKTRERRHEARGRREGEQPPWLKGKEGKDGDEEPKEEARRKTEGMIDAVLRGADPRKIVEAALKR